MSGANENISMVCLLCAFCECPCWENGLGNMKIDAGALFLVHNFLNNHMRYIHRQIYNWKEKSSAIKLGFFFFFLFLQTVVQPKFSISSCRFTQFSLVSVEQKDNLGADPAGYGSLHAAYSA